MGKLVSEITHKKKKPKWYEHSGSFLKWVARIAITVILSDALDWLLELITKVI